MDQTANYQERWTSKGLWSAFDKDPASALQTVPTLAQVRGWIVERMESKRSRRLLFLGLDGIAYDAMFRMTADMLGVQLAPVLSTVPSTSTSAWTTILTGLPPEQHGIYGAAHHLPHLGTSVFLFDPVLRTADGDAPAALSRQDLNQRCPETIFHDLKSFGRAHALGFADDLSRNGLLDLWLHEAEVDWLADAYPLYENPERLTEHLIARARPLIEGGDSVFVYFNFDWHIHDFGVTPALARSVRSLLLAAQALCRAHPDLTVAMVSDHGMRAQAPAPFTLLTDEEILAASRMPPGGGGRILYFYPKPGAEEHMRRALVERLDGQGEVLDRATYFARYYPCEPFEPERVGELVAIASGSAFPGAMPDSAYEHGGLSEEEMVAFFGWLH